ncbi:fimbria/pilus outer membrane usher protein (plasmid) [Enterobacter hormaechei]|uniref:fimbria/pilus outer membrane usher protein n=1 Tax=Enterobacter ludwigii TaxID=299767 RepID=UPI001BE0787D|nr:fimbria/pilus outer membrane usher protein [Enterobacter ludwigii]MBT1850635.1 fimbrial biogenesis outer membrane usher protein [Enterobacter ludwigii]
MTTQSPYRFPRAALACLISLLIPALAHAADSGTTAESSDVYFNPALLSVGNPNQDHVDLAVFEDGAQAPGKYRVDIFVNNDKVDTREVDFRLAEKAGKKHLQPCLTVADLQNYGVKTSLFPAIGDANAECADLNAIPQAEAQFMFSSQKLVLSIPQAALAPKARGYVDPALWDNGINALLLNYSFSGDSTHDRTGSGQDSNSQYANLRPGINIGPWRFRNYSTWNRDSNGLSHFESIYTYAQRNLVKLKGQMTLGDSSSPSDVFDSVPFRGAQIVSDDDMLPESQRGYAPVVRGIARTNAQVVIRQNGYEIYRSYVSPGAFEITDMYPTGGSGDLDVTIKEADGSEQHITVPFASLPVLQREGRFKYSATAGQYRSYDDNVEKTRFIQGTGIYGLPWGMTAYGGVQAAEYYRSLALGLGKNMGDVGALSADITLAKGALKDTAPKRGASMRIRYNKDITQTGTNFAIAGYRYSTSGYYTMAETLDTWRSDDSYDSSNVDRARNREELTMTQTLGEGMGNLSLSAIHEDYWDAHHSTESYSAGYNNSWKGMSYSINYTYSRNSTSSGDNDGSKVYDNDQMLSLNINIPFSNFLPGHTINASYGMTGTKGSGTSHTVGLNGTVLENNNLSWSVQNGYTTSDTSSTGNVNADYRGTYGEMTGGYSYDSNSSRVNYGVSGGMVLHKDGLTLSQPLGETIALVKAPGADGVKVNGQTGVKTDFRGYTVVPYETAYRKNDIGLDTESLGDDVDLTQTNKTVIPTRGAVVRAEFAARVGARALMTLKLPDGKYVPFGATVTTDNADSAEGFIVGSDGQVYLTGLADSGTLKVSGVNNGSCRVPYNIKDMHSDDGILKISAVCS